MIRSPAVAGAFYAAGKEDLTKQIERCFKSEIGAGLPGKRGSSEIVAGVAPHAGYAYSGPVASHLYKAIAESKKIDTFVILGPNHTGIGTAASIMPEGAWATPLGQAKIDSEIAAKLMRESKFIEMDDMAHVQEHSIEVQLPFLQYVDKDFKFVPICMMAQDLNTAEAIGQEIYNVCRDKNVMVIASSDFSHYEPQPVASKKDHMAIEAIEKLDVEAFYDVIASQNLSACGYGPITAAMTFAKAKGAKAKLLKYATSGDVTGDKTQVVGYATIGMR